MYYKNEYFALRQKAIETLNRLRNNEKSNSVVYENKNITRQLSIEPYSESAFKEKTNYDAAYFNTFLKNLEESKEKDEIINEISELYSLVKEIYKELDIKPQVYSSSSFIGKTTKDSIEETARRIINNYLDRNYYSLTFEERDRRYKDKVVDLATRLVTEEKVEIDASVQLAQKKILIENCISKFIFPLHVKGRLDEVLHEEADEFFDNTKIKDLYEKFEQKLDRVSLLLATIV